uniref:Uncharacterized protein n=1 Tax=Solanum tuberosum TaxID=4113 RepID=M1DHK6_SOLTU
MTPPMGLGEDLEVAYPRSVGGPMPRRWWSWVEAGPPLLPLSSINKPRFASTARGPTHDPWVGFPFRGSMCHVTSRGYPWVVIAIEPVGPGGQTSPFSRSHKPYSRHQTQHFSSSLLLPATLSNSSKQQQTTHFFRPNHYLKPPKNPSKPNLKPHQSSTKSNPFPSLFQQPNSPPESFSHFPFFSVKQPETRPKTTLTCPSPLQTTSRNTTLPPDPQHQTKSKTPSIFFLVSPVNSTPKPSSGEEPQGILAQSRCLLYTRNNPPPRALSSGELPRTSSSEQTPNQTHFTSTIKLEARITRSAKLYNSSELMKNQQHNQASIKAREQRPKHLNQLRRGIYSL